MFLDKAKFLVFVPPIMTPKQREQFNTTLDKRTKDILKEESDRLGMSMAEYIEKLVDGTLPGRLEKQIEELRVEFLAKIEEIKK